MNDIIIVNDVLSDQEYTAFKNQIEHINTPWFFISNSAFDDTSSNNYSFFHVILNNNQSGSNLLDPALNVLQTGLDKAKFNLKEVIRIRAGLMTSASTVVINKPHVDITTPHYTAIYYFNECDGETCFYNKKFTPSNKPAEEEHIRNKAEGESLTENDIVYKFSPKENTLVIFDGLIYHSSSRQTDIPRRIAINYNFI